MSTARQHSWASVGLLLLAVCRGCCSGVDTVSLDVDDGSYSAEDETVETGLQVDLNDDLVTIEYQSAAGLVSISYTVTKRAHVEQVEE